MKTIEQTTIFDAGVAIPVMDESAGSLAQIQRLLEKTYRQQQGLFKREKELEGMYQTALDALEYLMQKRMYGN